MWDFGIKDAIDILVVAILLYFLYHRTKASGTFMVFQGIVAVIFVWLIVSQVIQMRLLGSILDAVVNVGMIALIIIFQNEIRQMLIRLGSRRQWNTLLRFFGREQPAEAQLQWVDRTVLACKHLSEQKTGALIVIQGTDDLDEYIKTGDEIDAILSTRLLQQIFYKNTPLHDGAAIICGDRLRAAACILPVSHSKRIPAEFGLRHRSALGLAEVTDAKVIIVSEETGNITLASASRFHRDLTINALQRLLLKDAR